MLQINSIVWARAATNCADNKRSNQVGNVLEYRLSKESWYSAAIWRSCNSNGIVVKFCSYKAKKRQVRDTNKSEWKKKFHLIWLSFYCFLIIDFRLLSFVRNFAYALGVDWSVHGKAIKTPESEWRSFIAYWIRSVILVRSICYCHVFTAKQKGKLKISLLATVCGHSCIATLITAQEQVVRVFECKDMPNAKRSNIFRRFKVKRLKMLLVFHNWFLNYKHFTR